MWLTLCYLWFAMILKILGCGTSTGVPVPGCSCKVCTSSNPRNKRLRTSAVVQTEGGLNILIDCTTDFRQQALTHNLKSVDAVLFTHSHADHILGLDDLRGFNFVQENPIPAFATARVFEDLNRIFFYAFTPNPEYEGGSPPELEAHEIFESLPFEIDNIVFRPIPLMHGSWPVTGFRIGDLAYVTDVKTIPEASMRALKGVRFLVLDALRYEEHRTHMTFPQAISAAQQIGAEKTYFTHMTHSIDYDEINAKLPAGMELAYDGLEIKFGE